MPPLLICGQAMQPREVSVAFSQGVELLIKTSSDRDSKSIWISVARCSILHSPISHMSFFVLKWTLFFSSITENMAWYHSSSPSFGVTSLKLETLSSLSMAHDLLAKCWRAGEISGEFLGDWGASGAPPGLSRGSWFRGLFARRAAALQRAGSHFLLILPCTVTARRRVSW